MTGTPAQIVAAVIVILVTLIFVCVLGIIAVGTLGALLWLIGVVL